MRIKIILVDDHPIYRDGLRFVIGTQPDMEVAGDAGDGLAAFEAIRTIQPDLVLMDISLPRASGIEVCQRVRSEFPRVKIIILTAFADAEFVSQSVLAGVSGYLLKGGGTDEIIRAIRVAMEGHTYLSPEIASSVVAAYKNISQARIGSTKPILSEREREVLKWIAEGFSTKEIGAKLSIGFKTVETYRRRLMIKLGCNRATELVRYALREGIARLE